MDGSDERRRSLALSALRAGLAVFVLAWIFGPYTLRSAIPVWVAFLIALGLELHFFFNALRPAGAPPPDRGPQPVDRERYGYGGGDDLVLVRDAGEDFWVSYSGESDEEIDELIAEARRRAEEEPEEEDMSFDDGRRVPLAVRRLLAGLGVIAGLALVLWVAEYRSGWDGIDPDTRAEATRRFSAEASRIADKPVRIRCDESGDYVGAVQHADGVASVGGELAYLTPERCLDLYRLAFRGETRGSQTARSLAVLAHEAWHLRGVRDEGTTECYALQSAVELGRRLGLSEGTARQLMRQQLAENALRSGSSAEYLVPPECRDGGRLDLDPASTRFP